MPVYEKRKREDPALKVEPTGYMRLNAAAKEVLERRGVKWVQLATTLDGKWFEIRDGGDWWRGYKVGYVSSRALISARAFTGKLGLRGEKLLRMEEVRKVERPAIVSSVNEQPYPCEECEVIFRVRI